jgi:hypothetical protein
MAEPKQIKNALCFRGTQEVYTEFEEDYEVL